MRPQRRTYTHGALRHPCPSIQTSRTPDRGDALQHTVTFLRVDAGAMLADASEVKINGNTYFANNSADWSGGERLNVVQFDMLVSHFFGVAVCRI